MTVLLVATMIGFSVVPMANCLLGRKNKDYNLWYRTGRLVREGGQVYPTDHRPFPFMYPPSCAAMLGMLTLAGEPLFVVSLLLLNSLAWYASLRLSVNLATANDPTPSVLMYALPILCVLPYVHDMYLLGQPNLGLLALMLGALACLRSGRQGWAGALIAVAAAIKAFPALALAYLVYRRQWRAVVSAVVCLAALLLVLPVGFRGPQRTWSDLATWTRGMVLKYDAGRIAQRPERSYSFKNQSLVALTNRLLRSIPADGEANKVWRVNLVDLDFRKVNLLIFGLAGGLALLFAASIPKMRERTAESDAVEGAMLLIMILLFSPLSFNYFYVWLLYPLTVALRRVLDSPTGSRERARLVVWVGVVVTLLALTVPFPHVAQAYGNVFFASVLLLAGLAWSVSHTRRTPVLA